MGANLTAELKEAREITTDFLRIFAIEYSKMYLVALMKAAKKTIAKEAAGPQWVLLKCCKAPPPPALKTGTVKKLSKYLKKWNPRYCIAKGDHLVDYYESEEKYNAGAKPLGTINMSNKNLHRDANDTVLNRLIALAEKCGLNIDEMPKPEKYPDFTLEIYHERKGPIYLECENEEEWKGWCDILERCRWHAPKLNKYGDKAHVFAFPKALWRTRWELSMWGYWSGGGGEEAQLVDAINDKIADVVLGKLDRKLRMPWSVRHKIRNKFISTVDGVVTTAVGPAWKLAYSAVEAVRPKVEPKVKEGMQPIVDAQKKIQDEICKLVESSSKDFIDKKILPHLAPLLDVVFAPVVDGFKLIIRAFEVALERGRERYEAREDRLYMVWHHNHNSEYWDAERKMWDLYEPLWALRLVFEDIYPWSITGRARRRLRKTLDNALYTFETILEDGKESGMTWEQAAQETRGRLARDCRTGILRVLGVILFGVVENFFEKLVVRPARKLIKPLSKMVPDLIKDFVDPDDLLEELLYAILRRTCGMVFEPYAAKIDLGIQESTEGLVVTRSAAVDAPAPQQQQQQQPQQQQEVASTTQQQSSAVEQSDMADRHAPKEETAVASTADNEAAITKEAEEAAAAAAVAARVAEEEAAAAAAVLAAEQQAAAAAAKAAEEEAAAAAAKAAEDEAAAMAAEEEAAAAARAADEAAAAVAAAKAAEEEANTKSEQEAAAAAITATEEEAAAAAIKAEQQLAAAAKAAEEEAAAMKAAEDAAKAAEEEEAAAAAKAAEAEAIAATAAAAAAEAAEEACAVEAAAAAEAAAREAHVDPTAQAPEDSSDSIELVYFNIKGRAHATRLVLAIGGVPFKDTRLLPEQYGALVGTGALPLDTLPILKVEGQVISSQSLSMLRFAAELTDMQLSEPEDILRGEDVLGTAADLATLFGTWLSATGDEKTKHAQDIVQSGFSFYAKHIESVLATRTHEEVYICQTISFVDVFLYSICTFMNEVAASIDASIPLSEFPKVAALVDAVAALPAVREMH